MIPSKVLSHLRTKPDRDRKAAVVNDVQTGEVGELLSQYEEERVEEVEKFRDEKPPGHLQSSSTNLTVLSCEMSVLDLELSDN